MFSFIAFPVYMRCDGLPWNPILNPESETNLETRT